MELLPKLPKSSRSIARILTVHNQQQKEGIEKACAGQKYISKDLRMKKTRAMRRALTKKELGQKTLKQSKKDMHCPMRRYAVKASSCAKDHGYSRGDDESINNILNVASLAFSTYTI